MLPDHASITRLVMDTMTYYGSDAGERKEPGSKLRAQAEHVADVLTEYAEASSLIERFSHIRLTIRI